MCAWAALGHAVAGYDAALSCAGRRVQCGKPLVSFRLAQDRPAPAPSCASGQDAGQGHRDTPAQPSARRTDLAAGGRPEPTLAGLAKAHNTATARHVLAEARDLLGGNGILLDFHVARHMADIEAIHTFEGTETIQNLIVGRHITGFSAFV
ncbi:acyl-CoA dehydrogenase family protein [Streptomyces sp. NPDC001514]